MSNTGGIGDVSIDIRQYKEQFKPMLEKAAQLVVTHPELPDNAVELANTLNMMSVYMEQQLEHQVPEIVKLEEEVKKLDGQLRSVQMANSKLSSQVFDITQQRLQEYNKPAPDGLLPKDKIAAMLRA